MVLQKHKIDNIMILKIFKLFIQLNSMHPYYSIKEKKKYLE